MSEWQPIETAPKNGSRVLLWNPEWSGPCTAQFYGDAAGGWKLDKRMPPFAYQPTHWMPLPAPPNV